MASRAGHFDNEHVSSVQPPDPLSASLLRIQQRDRTFLVADSDAGLQLINSKVLSQEIKKIQQSMLRNRLKSAMFNQYKAVILMDHEDIAGFEISAKVFIENLQSEYLSLTRDLTTKLEEVDVSPTDFLIDEHMALLLSAEQQPHSTVKQISAEILSINRSDIQRSNLASWSLNEGYHDKPVTSNHSDFRSKFSETTTHSSGRADIDTPMRIEELESIPSVQIKKSDRKLPASEASASGIFSELPYRNPAVQKSFPITHTDIHQVMHSFIEILQLRKKKHFKKSNMLIKSGAGVQQARHNRAWDFSRMEPNQDYDITLSVCF